jgi:hypothetical protein
MERKETAVFIRRSTAEQFGERMKRRESIEAFKVVDHVWQQEHQGYRCMVKYGGYETYTAVTEQDMAAYI